MQAIDATKYTPDVHINRPEKSGKRRIDRSSSLTMECLSQLSIHVLSSLSARTSQLYFNGGTNTDVYIDPTAYSILMIRAPCSSAFASRTQHTTKT